MPNSTEEIHFSEYSTESLLELKQRIDDYIAKGYTRYEFSYERGWYESVENCKLTVSR